MEDLTNKNSEHFKVSFSNGKIDCRVLGNGRKKIICFYGIGQSVNHFRAISKIMDEYTFYVLDLPFHGDTLIEDPLMPLSASQVAEIIQNLKNHIQISQFSLMGISIGAKLAIQIAQNYPHEIETLILIAPDGIKENFWYRFATANRLFRAMFKHIIYSNKITNLLALGKSLKLLNHKTAAFVSHSVKSLDERKRIFNTWCYLRNLKVNVAVAAKVLNDHSVEVVFVVGENDRIIPKTSITKLSSKVDRAEILELKAEHHNILDSYCRNLMKSRMNQV